MFTNEADVTKAGELLGWEAQFDMRRGVEKLVEWYNAEREGCAGYSHAVRQSSLCREKASNFAVQRYFRLFLSAFFARAKRKWWMRWNQPGRRLFLFN
ncbi:MAG: hypothetical protein U0X93_14110 [Anaerolineales bacterium]